MSVARVSVEPSRRCKKACAFCYNGSHADGDGEWTADELVAFGRDLAAHGVEAISIGGGEPLEWDGLFEVLEALEGVLARSLTTNGLGLDGPTLDRLAHARPDKVHVSIHDARARGEVRRAIDAVRALDARGIPSGVNLLVARSRLDAARAAARALAAAGIERERVVFLPMRGHDTPSPEEVAAVAAGPFQSMTCLRGCGASPRFASVAADRTAAWCSYTRTRRRLAALTFGALTRALDGLGLAPCDAGQLVRLGAAPMAR
ncbi:MAG: radical SAM protein [Sandaracinaceae bacterium]|nr:radical SAM protein [Sandaracinaceae bacterium]